MSTSLIRKKANSRVRLSSNKPFFEEEYSSKEWGF
jgi:hypothetical protein